MAERFKFDDNWKCKTCRRKFPSAQARFEHKCGRKRGSSA